MKDATISFYTLGCRLNQSETAVIRNSFAAHGYQIMDSFQPADIMVINTCTVTEGGDNDTRRLINRLVRINPETRIALIGCQAQIQKTKLAAFQNVRWVIGNERKIDLVNILNMDAKREQPLVMTDAIGRDAFAVPFTGIDQQHTRANLKIQDGCDFFCSFCEIPYARGRSRSRIFSDIIKEADTLVRAGHQEIVITGINVGMYREKDKTIVDVIKALEDIPGLGRIRISSIELTTIPDELLDRMAGKSKLCRHLHIPLQSGHNEILQRMQRKYAVDDYLKFVSKAVDMVPGLCIGSDVMVGFPGEKEEHFDATGDVLKRAAIHYFHVFSYSRRNLAKSRLLTGPVAPKTIEARSAILRKLSQEKRKQFYQSHLGKEMQVLFEDQKNGYWSGLTDNFIRVKFKSSEDLANRFQTIKLQELAEQGITAEKI